MQKAILFIEEPACNETPFAGAVQELQRKDVSCSVCTPEDAVENLRRRTFALAVIKINCPDERLVDIMRAILDVQSALPILVVSMQTMQRNAVRLLRQGANAYVQRESLGTELLNAVDYVLRGHRYIS